MSASFVRALATVCRGLVVAVAALAVTACSAIGIGRITSGTAPYTDGSGTKTTVQRPLAAFHAIDASTGVTVVVHAGTPVAASVTADDNLLGQIVTEVRDGTLFVRLEGGVRTANPLRVELANSGVDAISASTGATVEADALAGSSVSVGASTGATVRATGTADSLHVTSSTGATADLRSVVAGQVDVDVSTGASTHVQPTATVTGKCTGGGSVFVHGKPARNDVAKDEGSTVKSAE